MEIYKQILQANNQIKSNTQYVNTTPLEKSINLSEKYNVDLFFKCEHFQRTGSFKYRGALNKILNLTSNEKINGVTAASTGNHGLGVSLAASICNIPATVYVPNNSCQDKLKLISSFGSKLIQVKSNDCLDAEKVARSNAKKNNQCFISPYNDLDIIYGQGTIGIEILDQVKDLDAIFVSVGGGGLISGIAHAVKSINSNIQIIGCWPENSPTLYDSLNLGYISKTSRDDDTLSDATAGKVEINSITLGLLKNHIDHKVLISEQEIKYAMKEILFSEKWVIEGSAAVAYAGFLKLRHLFEQKKIATLLCGRNISINKFIKIISE